jgi:hypothetical protein
VVLGPKRARDPGAPRSIEKQNEFLDSWARTGRPIPAPPRVKAEFVKEYGRVYRSRTLVETGTYLGDTMEYAQAHFDRLFSIELDREFHETARRRLEPFKNVALIQGDSGALLGPLLEEIDERCLLWLDAHWGWQSTAIKQELDAMREHVRKYRDVVLIDDARGFLGANGYPTIDEIFEWTESKLPGYHCTLQDDVFRLVPTDENTPLPARTRLSDFGWRVSSQSDEDGIIHEIFRRIGTTNRRFVEIGAGNGLENNTAYLLMSGWSGTWIDCDAANVDSICKFAVPQAARGHLVTVMATVRRDNVDEILGATGATGNVDLLSVDIDGNDYHVLRSMTLLKPRAVVLEYNGTYPPPSRWIMEYNPTHRWDGTDHFGASLTAYEEMMGERGYALVGCTRNGVNAFFIRADLLADRFENPHDPETHFQPLAYAPGA